MTLPPLTPREALRRRIAADARALDRCDRCTTAELAPVVADCAARYVETMRFGDTETLRLADANLRRAADMWRTT